MLIPDAYQMQSEGSGTTHFSPWSYDRHVPLAFYGSSFTPGIYRGQCAELCGQDHGFMPIVVKAVPKDEFTKWLDAQEALANPPAAPAAAPTASVSTNG